MTKFCSSCQSWQDSWVEHPNYNSYSTYNRDERCWGCDKWTLSDRSIYLFGSSRLNRQEIKRALNAVKEGQANRFICQIENYNDGELVHETVIYNGGENYTRIIERDGRQIIETKELQTLEEVLFLEMAELLQICTIQ